MRQIASAILAVLVLMPGAAERLEHKYVKGDKFRAVSTVNEDVFADNRLALQVDWMYRIAFSVEDAFPDGSGRLSGTFDSSERKRGARDSYLLTKRYESEFRRDRLGKFEIADRYLMPVVRDLPMFPDRDLKPGDTWTAPGEERHDLSESYGIREPLVIPFEARYKYLGPKTVDGKKLHELSVSYTIFFTPTKPSYPVSDYPARVMGSSDQIHLFDNELGMLHSYRERFRIVFDMARGRTLEFAGTAESKVTESELMDRTKVEEDVRRRLKELDVGSVDVRKSDEGVVISVEDIGFGADSAVLLPSERAKLDKISTILKSYPERDLLVGGHAALAGTEAGRQRLSEDRAKAVADYLVGAGARRPENVTVRGFGATRPIADNATEEGMRKNRRVEITILEN